MLPLAGVASAQGDLNCDDFGGDHARAQAELEKDPSDPHGLDRDKDGTACEALLNGSGSSSGGGTSNNTSTSGDSEDDDGEDDDGERQVSVVPQGGVETGDGTGTGTDLADPVAIGLGALAAMGVAAAVARRPAHGPR